VRDSVPTERLKQLVTWAAEARRFLG
jgi:hypothetical protein